MNRIIANVAHGYRKSDFSALFHSHIRSVHPAAELNADGSMDVIIIPISRTCRAELAKIPGWTVLPSLASPAPLPDVHLKRFAHVKDVQLGDTVYSVMKKLAAHHKAGGEHFDPDNSI